MTFASTQLDLALVFVNEPLYDVDPLQSPQPFFYFYFCISLTADGAKRSRIPIPPTATLSSRRRPLKSSPFLALRFFIVNMQVHHSYKSSTNEWLDFT